MNETEIYAEKKRIGRPPGPPSVKVQCTISAELAAQLEAAGLSPSQVLSEALQERLGDRRKKLRPLATQLDDLRKEFNAFKRQYRKDRTS